MEQKDFTEQMRNDIISAAKNSFLKLGINAEVTIEFKEDRSLRVKLTTSKFNTTPVLYKSIYVYGNAELTPVDGHDGIYDLFFFVDYMFETFSGGTNGTYLGKLKFRVFDCAKKVIFIGFEI